VDKLQTKGKPNLLVSDTKKKKSISTSCCQRDRVNRLKQREVAGWHQANVDNLLLVVGRASFQKSRNRWPAEREKNKNRRVFLPKRGIGVPEG